MKRIKINRHDLINDKFLAFEMWIKRWRDMALIGVEDKGNEALLMIRKISRECEEIE